MNKKRLILSLTLMATAGFMMIMLQHHITQVSLQIPAMEENYYQLKQQLDSLEFQVRTLKNPKRLFEEKEKLSVNRLSFPKQDQVIALTLDKVIPVSATETTKSSRPYLPLAKVFP